eukprot:snap_masked-scaffold_10-processed-gene-5.13-mRNA-1 protein AED:1.00 eAED:1.00 QI:0/0/0/0/1/1/3/0/63
MNAQIFMALNSIITFIFSLAIINIKKYTGIFGEDKSLFKQLFFNLKNKTFESEELKFSIYYFI